MIHKTFERLPEEKRKRVLMAARAEFISTSYEKTSINRILEKAGVPKGSFYQYFDDKSDLFSLCVCNVYSRLLKARQENNESLLESGMLRMKKQGFDVGYKSFNEDLKKYLSEEDFRLFEHMLAAPRHIRNYVQMNAASSLIAPVLKEELMQDPCVRTDIDYDYYAYLLSMTEVIPVDYGTRKGVPMDGLFYLSYEYMRSIYDSLLKGHDD